MSTSGTYSFLVTRDDIIRQAMLAIGKLDPYESPDPQQTVDCSMMLNALVKQWMGKADFARGLKVWTRKRGHLFLSNSAYQYTVGPGATGWTNSYVAPTLAAAAAASATSLTLSSTTSISAGYYIGIELDSGALYWTTVSTVTSSPVGVTIPASGLPSAASSGNQVFCYQTTAQQPLLIEAAVLREQDLTDSPVRIIQDVRDYDLLPNKVDPSNIADPTAIYYENQLTNSYLYTDCGAAQDVTKHLVLTYLEPVQDFNNATDNPYYPQEWYMALFWGLAKNICPMFNRPWTPLMQNNYDSALQIAGKKDPEISTMYFQPGAED
jgi:hypothetical protein